MEQFSLEKYLENPSRKVVTRDGRPVRIICTDAKGELPIVALVPFGNNEDAYHYNVNGVANGFQLLTLFFADEEEELTEFEKELNRIVIAFSDAHAYMDETEIHHYSKGLLDLARKELLKDLPKWKKITDETNLSLTLSNGEYYLPLEDLETLPKEE